MIKNTPKESKISSLDYSDDYKSISEGLTNPYGFNFGKVERNGSYRDFIHLKEKINMDYFYKK